MPDKRLTVTTGLMLVWASGVCLGASIQVRPDPETIQLLVEGPKPGTNFALVFDRSRAGICGWYDLDDDPKMERNLAPTGPGHCFTLFQSQAQIRLGGRNVDIMPGPAESLSLLEEHPERVVISVAGRLAKSDGLRPTEEFPKLIEMATGRQVPGNQLPRYEIRYTVYPTGAVYVQMVWDIRAVPLDLVTQHSILANAATEQFLALNDWKDGRQPLDWPVSFLLHHSDLVKTDALLTPHLGRYVSDWLAQSMSSTNPPCNWFRSGFSLCEKPKQLREGRYSWEFLLHLEPGTAGDREAAFDISEDYRHPDILSMTEEGWGELDINSQGDGNFDAYAERDGTYDILDGREGVRFGISGVKYPRFHPAFLVNGWEGPVPESIRMDGLVLVRKKDFNAFVEERKLLVQYLGVIVDRQARFEFLHRPGR